MAKGAAEQIDRCDPKVTKEIVDYRVKIEAISVPVPVKPFEHTIPWNSPVRDPLAKRGEPALYPVESLRATAGIGRFGSSGAGKEKEGVPGARRHCGRKSGQSLGRSHRTHR